MKIFIQINKFNKGGPGSFKKRLIGYLRDKTDIDVINDIKKEFDIELGFIEKIFNHNKPFVNRIDGCYHNHSLSKNIKIKKSIEKSEYVIYQSLFSRNMCEKILNVNKKNVIIYNGVDQEYINKIEKNKNIIPGSFVALSLWRKNKRPESMIKGFIKSKCNRHLYIIGDGINRRYDSEYIHYLGKLNQNEIFSIMKSCAYQLHLAYADPCPNSVVEGLSSGLNVLCVNSGGTPELVKDNGIILPVDDFFNKKIELNDVDYIDENLVADGISKLIKIKDRAYRPDLDIKKCVEKYISILKKVFLKET